jgi:hypothetical protein
MHSDDRKSRKRDSVIYFWGKADFRVMDKYLFSRKPGDWERNITLL